MPIKYGTENSNLLQDSLREIPTVAGRNDFLWALCGKLICHVDTVTLRQCIQMTQEQLEKLRRR
jgi:hypothetical protein